MKYLPEVRKVISLMSKQTSNLESLVAKVDEMLCDDLIKDFTLHRFKKVVSSDYFIYEVKEEDFNHIIDYIRQIQDILLPDIIVMAQTNRVDSFRILFRKG